MGIRSPHAHVLVLHFRFAQSQFYVERSCVDEDLQYGPKKRRDTDSGKRCVARCDGCSVRRPRLDPRIHSVVALALRTVRRPELRKIVPLANTAIYEMVQRGEFPRRFFLTSRCVVWDLAEVEAWIEERRRASDTASIQRAPTPDVRKRKTRPVRHQ